MRRQVVGVVAGVAVGAGLWGTGCSGAEQKEPDHPVPISVPKAECREVPDRATPLVVDWPSQQQVDLTAAMKDGVAVVAYGCDSLKVLPDCHIKGGYGYMGVTPRTDVLQLTSADELQANLPSHGPELAAQLAEHGAWDVALVTVGKTRTTLREVKLAEVEGECEGATHFVRGAYIGAYAMSSGNKGAEANADQVFAGAGSAQKSGDPRACNAATADSAAAPGSCAVAVRLELRGITGVVAKGGGKLDVEGGDCPKGMVMSKGKCTASSAAGHVCQPHDAKDCQAQCDKGNQPSCGHLAFLYQYEMGGLTRDLTKAGQLYKSACDAGVQYACTGVGIMMDRGTGGFTKDHTKAVTLHKQACDAGVDRGCVNLGFAYDRGRGVPMDRNIARKLYRRACNGGHPVGCNNLGWTAERDSDFVSARGLYEKACAGGAAIGCKNLANYFKQGKGGRKDLAVAADYYRRACEDLEQDTSAAAACNDLGFMLEKGHHTAPDPNRAVSYYEKACKLDNGWGCSNVFVLFAYGQVGLAKDPQRGLPFGDRGCLELKHGPSCIKLGDWHQSQGQTAEANAAYQAGCAAGHQPACAKTSSP